MTSSDGALLVGNRWLDGAEAADRARTGYGVAMDARKREFLADHIDPDADSFDLSTLGNEMIAISSGVLRGPAARCGYFTAVRCDEYSRLEPDARYRVELDMFVDELATLDLRFEHLERDRRRAPQLSALWLDDEVLSAWKAIAGAGDHLAIDAGRCRFAGQIAADDRPRMASIVRMMTAIAGVPERRAGELATALERFERMSAPARLRVDGEGFALPGSGDDIVVGVACAASIDSAASRLRTCVRARHSGGFRLVIADAAVERKHRPRWPDPQVEVCIGHARWLTSKAELPQPVRDVLARAQPTVLVFVEDQIVMSFAGWVAEASRLGAAVDFLRAFPGTGDGAPYR